METINIANNTTNLTGDSQPIVNAKTKANFEEIANILGAASEVVPVVRTNHPIVAANTASENIDALDAAIGADAELVPVTRTAGQLAVANSVYANLDALDTAIGFNAQMSAVPKVVVPSATVFQNLDKLDTQLGARLIKKTIGGVGVTGCDFNFATAANMNEQIIDLGAIIPARARILDAHTFTSAAFVFSGGGTTLVAETGTSSSGAELIASATVYALNAITQPAVGAGFTLVALSASAGHIYVSATPGANWSTNTAGKIEVIIVISDVTNL